MARNLLKNGILNSLDEGRIFVDCSTVSVDMLEILDNSGAKSGVSTARVPNVLKRDFSAHFKLELMNKDIGLAMVINKYLDSSIT